MKGHVFCFKIHLNLLLQESRVEGVKLPIGQCHVTGVYKQSNFSHKLGKVVSVNRSQAIYRSDQSIISKI